MNVFKDLLKLWHQEDLLSQAWQQSYDMLDLSYEMFTQAITILREGCDLEVVKALKARDIEINNYQKDVRRKVMTHYALKTENVDLVSGLVLINVVVDIERLGDYNKNILDLAIYHPGKLISEEISPKLTAIEQEIMSRFEATLTAVKSQDSGQAKALQATYQNMVNDASDKLVNSILTGKTKFGDETLTAVVALYARYLKRVGAHLKNITSVLVNPFDLIGYKIDD
ncbi:MAG: PhoU domain-containing protein [Candidatus Neomarinimicrobiota bacterium]